MMYPAISARWGATCWSNMASANASHTQLRASGPAKQALPSIRRSSRPTPAGSMARKSSQVHFEPRKVSRTDLDSYARAEGFSPIESDGFELDREPQFYLRKIAARHLPLTPAQRTRINVAVPYRGSARGRAQSSAIRMAGRSAPAAVERG